MTTTKFQGIRHQKGLRHSLWAEKQRPFVVLSRAYGLECMVPVMTQLYDCAREPSKSTPQEHHCKSIPRVLHHHHFKSTIPKPSNTTKPPVEELQGTVPRALQRHPFKISSVLQHHCKSLQNQSPPQSALNALGWHENFLHAECFAFQLETSRARPVLADGCLSMRLTLHDVAVVLQRGASFRSAFSSCVEHDTEPRHPCDCRHF